MYLGIFGMILTFLWYDVLMTSTLKIAASELLLTITKKNKEVKEIIKPEFAPGTGMGTGTGSGTKIGIKIGTNLGTKIGTANILKL